MRFLEEIGKRVILFDGAMGTQIQGLSLSDSDWDGKQGCNEILNVTAPAKIEGIHRAYLAAGSDVIETNTFGANRIVLADYGLSDRTEELNEAAARIARKAADSFASSSDRPRFVAGSIGPGTKLPSLGQIDFDTLRESYHAQAVGLLRGGVDLLLVETCQDLLQIKCAVIACADAIRDTGMSVPIAVSFTIEAGGTLLVGSDIGAVISTLLPLPVDIMGLNCALGPEQMRPYIAEVCRLFPGPVICQPNAGLPELVNGKLAYTLEAAPFADHLVRFVSELGVSIVGGCCGTTPEYISRLAATLHGTQTIAQRSDSAGAGSGDIVGAGHRAGSGAAEDAGSAAVPTPRQVVVEPRIASLFTSVSLNQVPKPFFVGERNNTNGSKDFKEALLSDDWDRAVQIGVRQQETGAHGIDVCVAYAGRNERADMEAAVSRLSTSVQVPLFLDSTDPAILEAGLKRYGGRAVINSINLEDGEEKAARILALARRFGAAVIALTIDETGMAKDRSTKLRIAERLAGLAFDRFGLPPGSLIIDPLTFTLGSGDESLRDSARETLEALRLIKERIPGALTILGVSNVSYGLSPAAREVLNTIFLSEAVNAGLDCAIVNVTKILPLPSIPDDRAAAARRLIYGGNTFAAGSAAAGIGQTVPEPGVPGSAETVVTGSAETGDPLLSYIGLFETAGGEGGGADTPGGTEPAGGPGAAAGNAAKETPEESLSRKIRKGDKSGLSQVLDEVLKTRKAGEIITEILIPAMRGVGELFGAGKLQLPFVLQSAEAMRESVNILAPHLEKSGGPVMKKIVLATVRGDVHDIGKNLVDIILSNNGYEVHNLGIKCEIERIIEEARRIGADAVGMSGLLVKSAQIMRDNIGEMARQGLDIPVLLGGAALTERFVAEECAPLIGSPVFYCRDAFDGLTAMEKIVTGAAAPADSEHVAGVPAPAKTTDSTAENAAVEHIERTGPLPEILPVALIPAIPFIGSRPVDDTSLDEIYSRMSEHLLFKTRWGYRKGKLSDEEYEALIEERVKPDFASLKERCINEGIFQPRGLYGFFPCRKQGDELIILDAQGEEKARFSFPRREAEPRLCLADYFRAEAAGDEAAAYGSGGDDPAGGGPAGGKRSGGPTDIIALQAVTLGPEIERRTRELFESDRYREYLLTHGLAVEATEAFAELVTERIRRELGFPEPYGGKGARGKRYSFGYPPCPDLSMNRRLLELLGAESIGITMTETDQMVPEHTTCAFFVHHPGAEYFVIEQG